MKMKPVSRAGQNGSAAAPARQTQKRAGERSRKLTRGEVALLDEINQNFGQVPLWWVRSHAAELSAQARRSNDTAALLRRDRSAWAKYYALGGKRMIGDESAAGAGKSNSNTVMAVATRVDGDFKFEGTPTGWEFFVRIPVDAKGVSDQSGDIEDGMMRRIERGARNLGISREAYWSRQVIAHYSRTAGVPELNKIVAGWFRVGVKPSACRQSARGNERS